MKFGKLFMDGSLVFIYKQEYDIIKNMEQNNNHNLTNDQKGNIKQINTAN